MRSIVPEVTGVVIDALRPRHPGNNGACCLWPRKHGFLRHLRPWVGGAPASHGSRYRRAHPAAIERRQLTITRARVQRMTALRRGLEVELLPAGVGTTTRLEVARSIESSALR